jgi:hypothetical protein
VLGNKAGLSGLMLQELAGGVVKADRAAVKVETEQQRQVIELGQDIDRRKVIWRRSRWGPKPRYDAERDVRILGKDAKLAEPRSFVGIEQVQVDADGCRN